MATLSTTDLKESVKRAIKKITNRRADHAGVPNGMFLLTNSVSFVGTDYDVVGDKIELMEFPPNTHLAALSVVADKEMDTGGTALRVGIGLNETGSESSFTSAVGGAFTNQPSNDGLEVISDAAGDTTQEITIIGTTTATDTVVAEVVTLNGTTQVATVKTDWGQVLAAYVSSGTLTAASTVTIREASGNQTVLTLTPAAPSKGREAVTSTEQSFGDQLVKIVASGSSTKQIGLEGTDSDGNAQYDSQALTGATQVLSNSRFSTVTYVLTGDLESSRTITISEQGPVLVTGSSVFTGIPTPLNFTGGSTPGTELLADVSDDMLQLQIEVAPTTGNSGTVTLAVKALVYHGAASTLD